MKKTLFIICIGTAMLSSCGEQENTKLPETRSAVGSAIPLQTIDQQMEACSASISTYNDLINQALGGDYDAMKKLDVAKDLILAKLEDLKKSSTRFSAKQSERFAAVQNKFEKVDRRIN